MKKINNANLQDKVDAHKYGSYFTKDDVKHAKCGLEIWKKTGKDEWTLVSDKGIKNPDLNGVPKSLGRRWTR